MFLWISRHATLLTYTSTKISFTENNLTIVISPYSNNTAESETHRNYSLGDLSANWNNYRG